MHCGRLRYRSAPKRSPEPTPHDSRSISIESFEEWTMSSLRQKLALKYRREQGKAGWILLWLLGVPIPVLLVLFLLRGCT
jgi:hypothetical protein